MPTNSLQALLSADIPDPTDFSTNELRQLDSSLRCTICSEFYDAPVTLSCGHCFCSLCIREHIVKEPECPSCRKPTVEMQFRLNPALEEAVAAWKRSRPTVLRLSREEHRIQSHACPDPKQTPRRKRPPIHVDATKRKRRAISDGSDSEIVCVAGPSMPSSEAATSSPIQAHDRRPAKRRETEPSSDIGEEELEPSSLVNCPICRRLVEYQLINRHMDGPECNNKTVSKSNHRSSKAGAKNEWSKILGKDSSRKGKRKASSESDEAMEKLPKVAYAVLKDKALKDLLVSQRLPSTGDRGTWILRHQRWVMMNNANLDKSEGNRKSLAELRSELKKWEEERMEPKRVVEDTAAHEAAYHDDFKRLVEQARRTKITKASGPGASSPRTSCGRRDKDVVEDSEEEQL